MTSQETGGAAAAASTAKDEAAGLAQSAADSGQDLLHEVKDEVGEVAGEAASQARDLMGEARDGVREQASAQQARAAASLRSLGDELGRMADGSQEPGLGTDLVRQAAQRTGAVATWLEDREPGDVLHEVTDFARRRPGVFLALALGAGVAAGRLTRGLKDAPPSPQRGSAGSAAQTAEPEPTPVPDTEPVPATTGWAGTAESEAWAASGGAAGGGVAGGGVTGTAQTGDPLGQGPTGDRP